MTAKPARPGAVERAKIVSVMNIFEDNGRGPVSLCLVWKTKPSLYDLECRIDVAAKQIKDDESPLRGFILDLFCGDIKRAIKIFKAQPARRANTRPGLQRAIETKRG